MTNGGGKQGVVLWVETLHVDYLLCVYFYL